MYFCLVHLAFNVFQLTALMFGLVSERSSTCFKKKKTAQTDEEICGLDSALLLENMREDIECFVNFVNHLFVRLNICNRTYPIGGEFTSNNQGHF